MDNKKIWVETRKDGKSCCLGVLCDPRRGRPAKKVKPYKLNRKVMEYQYRHPSL